MNMAFQNFTASDIALVIGATAAAVGYVIGVWKGTIAPTPPELHQVAQLAAKAMDRADDAHDRIDGLTEPKKVA